jgi:hypothetical protein
MNIKNILVREGTILTGIFAVTASLCLLGNILSNPGKGNGFDQLIFQRQFEMIALYLYPLYLLLHPIIHFIIWAKNIKKTMARLGLVLLGCLLVAGVMAGLAILGLHFYHLFFDRKPLFFHHILRWLDPFHSLKEFSLLMALFGYPLYRLVSLIVRAIKTQKSQA